MQLYAIHAPAVALSAPEKIRASRTGFTLAGLVFGPLWLLACGLWRALLAYALMAAAAWLALRAGVLAPGAGLALFALGQLYIAFEGRALRSAARGRGGRPVADVIFAHSALEAEKLFLERNLMRPAPSWRGGAPVAGDVIGSFPEPGR